MIAPGNGQVGGDNLGAVLTAFLAEHLGWWRFSGADLTDSFSHIFRTTTIDYDQEAHPR